MKKITLAVLLAALALGACSKKGVGVKLRTDTDSVAYIIGMNVGKNLLGMDSTLNLDAVCAGMRDAYAADTKLSFADAEVYYLRYVNYMLPEKARAYEKKFIEEIVKSNRSYALTQSGVAYTVDELGDQEMVPTSDRDSVVMRYLIRTSDGKDVYSSYVRKDTVRMAVGDLTNGMRESVRLIGKGGKLLAWMPSAAAYGAEGEPKMGIAPNATLYYEIELVDVDKYATRLR